MSDICLYAQRAEWDSALLAVVLTALVGCSSTPMNPEYGSLTAGENFHCVRGVSSLCDRTD